MIETLSASSGQVVIASSRKDEVSWTGTPYTAFTRAVLEALPGYGAFEQNRYARVLDLALYVGRLVASRTDNKQQPRKLEWAAGAAEVAPARKILANWRDALLLIVEEWMSEYVEYHSRWSEISGVRSRKSARWSGSWGWGSSGDMGTRVERRCVRLLRSWGRRHP